MGRSSPLAILALLVLVVPAAAQDWRGRARVDGRVTDADGNPLPGATVAAERPSGETGPRVMSDAAGLWILDGLAPGSWTLVISAPGFRTARLGVHLPNESSWVAPPEVRLRRPPPREPAQPSGPRRENEGPPAVEDSREEASAVDAAGVRAALAAGRVALAWERASALGTDDPSVGPLLVEVGVALLAAGSTAKAVLCLDRAVVVAPKHGEAHYRRALGLLALGRHAEARRGFETLLALDPEGSHADQARTALDELSKSPK